MRRREAPWKQAHILNSTDTLPGHDALLAALLCWTEQSNVRTSGRLAPDGKYPFGRDRSPVDATRAPSAPCNLDLTTKISPKLHK